jgi:hypothetical protein
VFLLKRFKESPDPIPELAEESQVSENFMRKKLKFMESMLGVRYANENKN